MANVTVRCRSGAGATPRVAARREPAARGSWQDQKRKRSDTRKHRGSPGRRDTRKHLVSLSLASKGIGASSRSRGSGATSGPAWPSLASGTAERSRRSSRSQDEPQGAARAPDVRPPRGSLPPATNRGWKPLPRSRSKPHRSNGWPCAHRRTALRRWPWPPAPVEAGSPDPAWPPRRHDGSKLDDMTRTRMPPSPPRHELARRCTANPAPVRSCLHSRR